MAAPKQGGFKMSLGGLKSKPGLKALGATQNLAKRPRLALGEDEVDDSNKHQEISGFDAEGGVMDVNGKTKEKQGPLVIPALPNRNWGEKMREAKREREEVSKKQNGGDGEVAEEEKKVEFGLTFAKKERGGDEEMNDRVPIEASEEKDNLTEEQRLEKNALDALLHGKPTEEHVIPIQTEEEAFKNDMKEAPDAPTLEAYEATPIEGFGAALLRGMGWKDGQSIGRNGAPAKQVELKRRPALLGIGAKEEAAVGVELGEWGKGKKSKAVQSYNPIALKNKNTGEILTEEELKAKIEAQSMVKDEKPSKSTSSKYANEDEERSREKRDRRQNDEYDSERRDRNRRDERRREGDDKYYDSDRRRDRRRDRDRDRDDDYHDSDRRKEKRREKERRDRSRSPDERKEKRRERDRRDRSRSRDSDYRREKRRDRDRDRDRERRDRSRSRDSEDRRKRRRDREYDHDDDRDDRKRRHKDDRYSSSRR